MTNIEADKSGLELVKARARLLSHVERAHRMLLAAALAALMIVLVAGAMMTSWF